MAITYIDSNTQDSAGAQSLTFTIPAGATTDDFMIAFVKQSENTAQQTWDDDGGGGNGWTRLAYNRTTGGRDQETAIFYKRHSGTESNPTFTWNTGGTNEPMSGALLIYRGVDTLQPVNDHGYLNAQNDGNPPNPSVGVAYSGTRVVCFHAATHDDISSTAPPTGFTMRAEVYGGSAQHTADHRDLFAADINHNTVETYSPPDWQHAVSNATPEYHTYSVSLNELLPLHLTDVNTNEQIDVGELNNILTGDGFEATQGTGKLEIWTDVSGTTKVTQTIDTWSDTSIQFDVVSTGLAEGANYLVVTNDSGDISGAFSFNYGEVAYKEYVLSLAPDIYHRFNNTYDDEKGVAAANSQNTSGSFGFQATPITRNNTHSWAVDNNNSRIEMDDTIYTNVTNAHTMRYIGGWIQLDRVHLVPSGFYEEGGGVNNLYMVVGFGNVLLGNVADTSNGFKIQAFSDFKLSVDRPYHCMIFYQGSGGTNEFGMYVDGKKVSKTDGNPVGNTVMASHSGDWSYGKPDGSLDTGGTDIDYPSATNTLISDFGTWSAVGGGAPLTDTEVRNLFLYGVIPTDSLSADTGANMQTAMDAIAPIDYIDEPCPLKIYKATDNGGDLTLDLDDVTFDSRCSVEVLWMGNSGETLTLVNNGTSNATLGNCETPNGGTIVIQNPASLTLNGLVSGSIVSLFDDEVSNTENFDTRLGYTASSGTTFIYSHDGTSNSIKIQVIHPNYQEVIIPHTLDSTDQSVTINQILDTND